MTKTNKPEGKQHRYRIGINKDSNAFFTQYAEQRGVSIPAALGMFLNNHASARNDFRPDMYWLTFLITEMAKTMIPESSSIRVKRMLDVLEPDGIGPRHDLLHYAMFPNIPKPERT